MKKTIIFAVLLLSIGTLSACDSDTEESTTGSADNIGVNLEVMGEEGMEEEGSNLGMNIEVMETSSDENVGINLNVITAPENAE